MTDALPATRAQARRKRPEIQALRAVAVLAVVIFHLWPNLLPGGYVGVDVFFVISGFLITAHILRDVSAGRFRLRDFWARRVRRLLPASLLVLVVTAVSVLIWVPQSLWQQWLREIGASALYVENWVLASDAVDYLAAENQASPVQHFWSLSVEEQFYLVWPLLLLLGVAVALLLRRRASRVPMIVVLGVVVVGSFAAGLWFTAYDPGVAYFSTFVRAWEFGAGALLAFLPDFLKSARKSRIAVSWFGLALIAGSALLYTPETPFPGYAAAVPVIGAVLVIWAGSPRGLFSTSTISELRPVQFLGDVSYSVYLWHWPIIIILPFVTGAILTTPMKFGIFAAAVVLGWLSARFVEKPFILVGPFVKKRPWLSFVGALAGMAVVVSVSAGGITTVQNEIANAIPRAQALVDSGAPCVGAAARPPGGENCVNPDLEGMAVPAPIAAAADFPQLFRGTCEGTSKTDTRVAPCEYGNQDSDVRIALIGDSHASQYAATFQKIVDDNGWAVDIYSKGACPYSDVRRVGDDVLTAACTEWHDNARELLVDGNYDLIVTSQVSGVEWPSEDGKTPEETAEDGLVVAWQDLIDSGTPVVAIADNPRPVSKVLDCLGAPGVNVDEDCRNKRSKALLYDPQLGAAERMGEGFTLIDFTDVYCGTKSCLPVIGGVTVNRDANHLTNTFAKTLAPFVEEQLPLAAGAR